jgi:hypothetical protein
MPKVVSDERLYVGRWMGGSVGVPLKMGREGSAGI